MNKQMKKMDELPVEELMIAAVLYEEFMHDIVQNIILVKRGDWDKLICDSTDFEARAYYHWLKKSVQDKKIDAYELRHASLNYLYYSDGLY